MKYRFFVLLCLLQILVLHRLAAVHTAYAQEGAPFFADGSVEAGIVGNRLSTDKTIGQAWGDYDSDGRPDLYVTDSHGPNTLYYNEGDGTFTVSDLADQVALPDAYSQGVTFVDYDNDGWKDLYVLNWGANTLFRNEAGDGFTDVTEIAGVGGSKNSKSAAWGDYDQDGFVDLYVANWACYPDCGRPMTGDADRLYHNNGDGAFTDVSRLLGGATAGAGFVANFVDYDNDGDPDIYLVNDEFINPIGNKLWRNDGPGCDGWCFAEIAEEAKADTQLMGMGLATADYDNDGDLDLYFSNAGPMALLQNQGDGAFADVALRAGVDLSQEIGWGAVFFDYDNDGWRDLYVAVAETTGEGAPANPLLHNRGDGTFIDVGEISGAADSGASLGVAYADYDADGRVDLVVGNHDGGYVLYRNQGVSGADNHWLALTLVGAGDVNRDAIGARVHISSSDNLTQLQEVSNGSSLGAGNDQTLHFGLGHSLVAESVTVVWPDGLSQTFESVPADQHVTLHYPIDEEAKSAQARALYAQRLAPAELLSAFTSALRDRQPIPTPTPNPEDAPADAPEGTSNLLPSGANGLPWWNDTVFYEIFVRSFKDSDGDGVGDLNGLIERLDYLNDGDPDTTDDLGVTGIWLMPIMESPSYHGYDVVDYYQVDSEYGTNEDFQRLVKEAHSRGIRVIVDLVLNHTSRQHPWFLNARKPNTEHRDWYVWSAQNPGYRGPWGQPVWHRTSDGYYYGIFWEGMPDINLENPDASQEMLETAAFWLEEMGADGFRLDAIKHLIEDGRIQENTDATHNWLKVFFDAYKAVNPDAFAVGEAWTTTEQVLDYTGDEVDIAFQFELAEDIVNSSKVGVGSIVGKTQRSIVDSFPPNQYATFIANHDQNRVLSQLRGDEGKAKVAASILLTGPGVPFLFYGEEIGMMGTKPDEDIRRPMQWSGENRGSGFTEGRPWRAPFQDYEERNVELQTLDPDSLLSHYRNLVHLRNSHEALRVGDWTLIASRPGKVYAVLRHVENEPILVVINMSDREISDYSLALASGPLVEGMDATLLLGEGSAVVPAVNEAGGFAEYVPIETLSPHGTYVVQLSPSR